MTTWVLTLALNLDQTSWMVKIRRLSTYQCADSGSCFLKVLLLNIYKYIAVCLNQSMKLWQSLCLKITLFIQQNSAYRNLYLHDDMKKRKEKIEHVPPLLLAHRTHTHGADTEQLLH